MNDPKRGWTILQAGMKRLLRMIGHSPTPVGTPATKPSRGVLANYSHIPRLNRRVMNCTDGGDGLEYEPLDRS